MIRKHFLLTLLLFFSLSILNAQTGKLEGKVLDIKTSESIPFTTLALSDSSAAILNTTSDYDGDFAFPAVKAGKYSLKVTFIGYKSLIINDIIISPDKITNLDVKLESTAIQLQTFEKVEYFVPVIRKDMGTSGTAVHQNAIVSTTLSKQASNKIDSKSIADDVDEFETGQLTASQLNDYSKWNLWQDIRSNDLKAFQHLWEISPVYRYSIQVLSNENKAIIDAEVSLQNNENQVLWKSKTDNTGKAELWAGMFKTEKRKKLKLAVNYQGNTYQIPHPTPFQEGINVIRLPFICAVPDKIDIAFVVDATGSMDDEINYLKEELIDILKHSKDKLPGTSISLGSVFYRCYGNSFVTRTCQLNTDIEKTISFIDNQTAKEGGDEVVEEALRVAVDSLGWSSNARARLLFFVMDEQPLTKKDIVSKLHVYIKKAAEMGIRIIPVIASAETPSNAYSMEYLMRSIALATNGTYVFLTDHSKIGDTHSKPTTDQYDVEILNKLIKRLIYEYCYIPSCQEKINAEGVKDTTYVTNSPIIAHEIIDASRTKQEVSPKQNLTDYTHSTKTDTLIKDNSVSQNQNVENSKIEKANGFKFYPNPTTGKITIEVEGKINVLYLTDISGKLLTTFSPPKELALSIDLSNYSTGIYIIKFQDNFQWYSGKIILNKP